MFLDKGLVVVYILVILESIAILLRFGHLLGIVCYIRNSFNRLWNVYFIVRFFFVHLVYSSTSILIHVVLVILYLVFIFHINGVKIGVTLLFLVLHRRIILCISGKLRKYVTCIDVIFPFKQDNTPRLLSVQIKLKKRYTITSPNEQHLPEQITQPTRLFKKSP